MTEHEASMNFDLENLKSFMHRISAKVEGLSGDLVEALVSETSDMAVESQKDWIFDVVIRRQPDTPQDTGYHDGPQSP